MLTQVYLNYEEVKPLTSATGKWNYATSIEVCKEIIIIFFFETAFNKVKYII